VQSAKRDEVDYPAALKIFDDGNLMPRTWIEWRKIAEEMEKGLKAYGHPVMRSVSIRPQSRPGAPRMARLRAGKDANCLSRRR
jgi:hypothetical protein